MTGPTRTHLVAGEFDQVAAAMATARESGRLVRVLSAEVVADGWVEVVAELREPARATRRWRPWLQVAAAVLGLAAVAGLVWLLVLAVMAIVSLVTAVAAWVQAHLAALVLVAIALVVLVCAGGSRCSGLHCGGVPPMNTHTSGRSTQLAMRMRTAAREQAAPELGPKALRLVLRELLFDGQDMPDWRRAAACAGPGVDAELFHPPQGWASDLAEVAAKRICSGCPVRAACLADAMSWEDPNQWHGVLGGLTPAERAALAEVGGAA